MTAAFRVVPFSPEYDSSAFESLDQHLTAYLKEGRAQRDLSTGQAAVFLMVDEADRVQGYYTLSSASVPRKEAFSGTQARKFPYPQVAVTLLGRVAIHKDLRGQGIGTDLILHALRQAARAAETVASYAVILDAKNEKVAVLYARLGFVPFRDQPLKLFLPIETIRQLS
ncbi:GCN5-related N-acetyltransferase (plasmid) [Deinococcus geothermalis DSM 11300]|uniref:GCN5-related N-acetyltransferase n=1 Tax=Deinococcus geothermalis (strain DSM 11300 / CIP 105573 / AG-3a) TaxID=319795 RepID=A8ZR74_DEIGD|nr:GNAT family N-acetyltransferase [Deinococcus geothermalis]ABW34983.1 GCN5-related N-acetyltransferase [Deinococcus geothermalis DSM 11300]